MSWVQLDTNSSGNQPKGRHCHSCVSNQNNIYLFGGTDGKQKFNDVHVFDTAKKGWIQLKTTGTKPTPRFCAAIALYKQYLIVFGGFDGQRTNTLHSLNLRTLEWERIIMEGNIPSPRSHHTLFSYKDYIYLYGGLTDEGKLSNDLHCLIFEKREWKLINTSGTPPLGRVDHAASQITNFLFIFGGYDGKVRLNDIHLLDLETYIWSEPLIHGSIPSKRLGQSSASLGNKIILFGGDDGNKNRVHLNDVHIFDLCTMMWSYQDTIGDIPPGRNHSTLTLVGNHNLYLYGGSGLSKVKYADMHSLNLESIEVFQLYWFDLIGNRIFKEVSTFVHKMNDYISKYGKKTLMDSDTDTDNESDKKSRLKHDRRNLELKEEKKTEILKEEKKSEPSESKDERKNTSPTQIIRSVGFVDTQQPKKKNRRKRGSRDNSSKIKADIIMRSRSQSPPSSAISSLRGEEDMNICKIIFDDSDYSDEEIESSLVLQSVKRMIEDIRSNFNRIMEEKENFQEWSRAESSKCKENKIIETLQGEEIEKLINQQTSHVLLNVGGTLFETSLDVLTSEKNSMLEAMFSGRYTMEKNDDKFYFIDRDGTHFKHILNYLRYGEKVILQPQESFLRELYHEALFYQLEGLMTLITKKLTNPDFPKESPVEF